jgi:hypothetical protein
MKILVCFLLTVLFVETVIICVRGFILYKMKSSEVQRNRRTFDYSFDKSFE